VNEELAKQRFMILNMVRLIALIIVMAGAANVAGKLWVSMAPVLGYILLVIGAADFFFAPTMLKKIWHKRDQ
jgi:hypothetical protein